MADDGEAKNVPELGNMGWLSEDCTFQCISSPDPASFKVRSKQYLNDSVKQPSVEAAFELAGVDLLLWDEKIEHIAANPFHYTVLADRPPGSPFLFIVNFQLPFGSFIVYCQAREGSDGFKTGDPIFDNLFQQYLEGDDDFRDSRFKIIPRLVEGGWMVSYAVGSKPAILGRKVAQTHFIGEDYYELDVDIGASAMANSILSVVMGSVSSLTIDLAFVIQGNSEEELPERLVGAFRFHKMSLKLARRFGQPRFPDPLEQQAALTAAEAEAEAAGARAAEGGAGGGGTTKRKWW